MRSSRPLLARSNMATTTPSQTSSANISQAGPNVPPPIPSIRLITATPSASGLSSEASTSYNRSLEESWAQQSVIAPKTDVIEQPRKKLIPKKSKLSILGMGSRDKEKDRAKDFSDVVRRIGAPASASGRGGFEIYVDPTFDPDIGEIVMVKKKKSRVALDGMNWGTLGETTNVPKNLPQQEIQTQPAKTKENPALLKVKVEEERKWWTIGRGRKDSKEKSSKDKENKMSINAQPVEFIYKPPELANTPPLKPSEESRGRFNSLDSGLLLGISSKKNASVRSNKAPGAPAPHLSEPEPERARSATPTAGMFLRSATPTIGGLLAPPSQTQVEGKQGSIAIRAIRSMRSLARMGSWAQMKGTSHPTAQEMAEEMAKAESEGEKRKERKKEKDGTLKEKKKSKKGEDDEKKSKKRKKEKGKSQEDGSGTVKKSSMKKVGKDKARTMRISTSSFEVGHLSASPEATKTLGTKKHSILGLGLPSTMRLPRIRGGSTASSVILNAGSSMTQSNLAAAPGAASAFLNPNNPSGTLTAPQPSRLSVETAVQAGRDRSASVASSNGSSLRPVSVTSSNSRLSTGSSVISGTSVRWDEEGLETVREQRRKEREERRLSEDSVATNEKAERRTSKESRRSSEGRRRMPLSSIFPEVQHHHIGTAMLQDVTEESSKIVQEDVIDDQRDDSDGVSMASFNTTSSSMRMRRRSYGQYPILTIEEATSDGHGDPEEETTESEEGKLPATTPVKRTRVRPLSEQLLGKSRPKAMHEDEEGVISILSAATNDLALLINTLDLQATPGTPDMTPLKPLNGQTAFNASPLRMSQDDSPLKRTLKSNVSSIASLRPYAQSRGYAGKLTMPPPTSIAPTPLSPKRRQVQTRKSHADLIGQQIAPWPVLIAAVSPGKDDTPPTEVCKPTPPSSTFKPGHKRTMTPAREPDPEPVFQPLKPARSRALLVGNSAGIRAPKSNLNLTVNAPSKGDTSTSFSSSLTFGRKASRDTTGTLTLEELSSTGNGSLTPVFKRIQDVEESKRASLCPADYRGKSSRTHLGEGGSPALSDSFGESFSVPIARDARKILGMSGTLGGSDVSAYDEPQPGASDPDSDVPDELRFLLAGQSDRGSVAESLSFQDEEASICVVPTVTPLSMLCKDLPDPLVVPTIELPVFQASLVDEEQNHFAIDGDELHSSDEDTKKSFDFTGELQKLNESGASDRASFVEQLEMAFKTPAKVDLRYDFGTHLRVEVPPVPALPSDFGASFEGNGTSSSFQSLHQSQSQLLDVEESSMLQGGEMDETCSISEPCLGFSQFSASRMIADVKEPTFVQDDDDTPDEAINSDDVRLSDVRLARSTGSRPSDGELDRSFRFGGLPQNESSLEDTKPLTLSDIIPPPECARAISEASLQLDDLEDDSVLRSIYAKLIGKNLADKTSNNSTSFDRVNHPINTFTGVSRPTSGVSFAGLESFEEVRRGFEFSGDRSFYPPPARNSRAPHRREDSAFSIASVSSYGRVLNNGVSDPFDYGLPRLQERPSCEDISSISMSLTVDDTFAFIRGKPRTRVDSDASSFYFHAPARGHGRRESNMSVSSQVPPISLYNRNFGHRRNDSTASSSSIAHSYARHGANSGFSAWARHRKDPSVDSLMSDFSALHPARPGLGDKMFEGVSDHGPLSSISASPPENTDVSHNLISHRASFDSIMDDGQRSSMDDSLFEKTGQRSSMSSDSVFGDDLSHPYEGGLLPPNQFRPLSVMSVSSVHSPMREDDTMISMLGGGHARRRSIGSIIEASPCVRIEKRIEKRKHANGQDCKVYKNNQSPNKARIVEKPSISSTSSFQFGGERMIRAQRGLLERQSLEDSCLIADGEDISGFCVPVFTRPLPARSRSSTCTSSSGIDTPPLSASDGSSNSGGSQSSIDLSQLNIALANATHPMSNIARNRARARARGTGHRRRYSKAHMSRSSVYETIEEENPNLASPASVVSKKDDPTTRQAIFIVDADMASIHSKTEEPQWDDEQGIVALRKFYALRDEAQDTVLESKRTWLDTPFSVFAVQTFQPPHHPAGMQALLEHSVQSYGPLPSELRPRRIRSRTSSRPSPYPQTRISKSTVSPMTTQDTLVRIPRNLDTSVLRPVNVNHNTSSSPPTLDIIIKDFSPLVANMDMGKEQEPKCENATARPRVGSTARRTALGWSKRNGKSSTDRKENTVGKENTGHGNLMTPGESLRLSRPRPKGRTPGGRTPAPKNRPIRV